MKPLILHSASHCGGIAGDFEKGRCAESHWFAVPPMLARGSWPLLQMLGDDSMTALLMLHVRNGWAIK